MFSKLIPEEYYPVLSDYAKILIPSLITYLVTRYTLTRPKLYEIHTKQFEQVYLPLYLLANQFNATKPQNRDVTAFIHKVEKIIYRNYPLVYPKTIKLFSKYKEDIAKKQKSNFSFDNFIYQIDTDYEKLKRELGYPTDSFFDFVKRLNKIDKIIYFVYLIFISCGIYGVVSGISLLFTGDLFNAFCALLCSLPCFFVVYLAYYGYH